MSRPAPRTDLRVVPEPKRSKNRLHLDFRPDDQQAEVARFLRAGARRVDIGQGSSPWVVLAYPEDNEFDSQPSRNQAY
jgi:Glyoxalase-like domain